MKHIPAKWLNKSVSFYSFTGSDDDNNPEYSAVQALSKVRIEYGVKTVLASTGETLVDDAVVYYDPVQSSPKVLAFPRKSKIVFNNDNFILREADPFYDENGILHHWELRLTGNEG